MSVPLARRNLWHERGKLLLSVLGVAASLTMVMLLFGFRNGLFAAASAYIDHMDADLIVMQSGSQGALSASALPAAIHDTLGATSGVVEAEHALVSPFIFTYGNVKWATTLVGYNPDTGIGGPWDLSEGRAVEGDEEIVLDTWLARRIGVGIGDEVEVLGRKFRIVGLSRGTYSWLGAYVFVSRRAAEEVLQLPGIASFYVVRLPGGADAAEVAETIEAQVSGIETMTPAEWTQLSWRLLGSTLNTPINTILVIGIATGVAVMGLTAYTAVIDRMREYGVLKAVGASVNWLRRLIITETLYRALLGFLLGTGLSYLTAKLIMEVFPQFLLVMRLDTILAAGVVTVVMTVLAALLPLRRVAMIDPVLVFKA